MKITLLVSTTDRPALMPRANKLAPTIYLLTFLLWPHISAIAEPFRIGALLDLTGVYSTEAQAFSRGIELGAKEVNKTNPGTIELFVEDTSFSAKAAVTAAQRLISEKKVAALITMSATEQKSVALIAKNFKVLTVSLWDSSPEIEALGDYSFGFGPWTPATGEKSAEFTISKLKAKTAYIITQQDEWSELSGNYFKSNFERLGGTVVGLDKLDPDTTDYRATITKIRASKADAVFFPLAKNVSVFIKQAEQQNLPQRLVTADLLNEEEIKNAEGAAEGIYHLSADASDSEKAKKLFSNYKSRYGEEPGLKTFVSWGYDAIMILADSWKRANQKGGAELAEAVKLTKELEVSSGKVSINERGSAPKFPVPHQVQNGKLVTISAN